MRRLPSRQLRLLAIAVAALAAGAPPRLLAESVEATLSLAPDAPDRLVLAHWPAQGWIVRQDGRRVEVEFPGTRMALRTPEMPVGRPAFASMAVEFSGGATFLRIDLGCDCTVAIRGDGQQLEIDAVGVDLAAGPIHRASGPAPRLAPAPPRRPSEADRDRSDPPLQTRAAQDMGREAGLDPSAGASASLHGEPPGAAAGARAAPSLAVGGAAPGGTAGDKPLDLEVTRDRLLGEIRQAAESGLITLRAEPDRIAATLGADEHAGGVRNYRDVSGAQGVGVSEHPAGAAASHDDAPGSDLELGASSGGGGGPVAAWGEGDAAQAAPHGRLHSAAGRPASALQTVARDHAADLAAARSPAIAAAGGGCLPNEAFVLPDPMSPDDLVRRIAALRRGLVGEFDRSDPGALAALARLYIANGLGAEAGWLLADSDAEVPDRDVLAALATLSEERPLPEGNVLSVPGCSGQHALWQAFDAALGGRDADAVAFEAAAAGALEQVARGLRGRIAARVGLAAAATGDRGATHRLLAMARRGVEPGDGTGQETLELLAAEDDRLFGKRADRVARLARLSQGRSEAGEAALLALAAEIGDHASSAAGSVDAGLVNRVRLDLGALALSARGSARGEAAFLAEVRLTARALGRDAAFGLLEHGHRDGSLSEPAYRSELLAMAELAAGPADTELALLYASAPDRYAASLADRGFRQALARSYAGLGAPALAQSVLRDGDLDDPAVAVSLAQAYLAAGEGERAKNLAGLMPEGKDRAAVSAEAARLTGDTASVLPALVAAGAPAARRAAAAWSIADWGAAFAALSEQGTTAPGLDASPAHAVRGAAKLAFAARQAGLAELPREARPLPGRNSAVEAGLEAMFAPLDLGEGRAPATVPAQLNRVRAENRLLEALLNDG